MASELKTLLMTTAAIIALCTPTHKVMASPEGGLVVGGSANISRNGTKTDIYQQSNKAILDWRSFDIGAQEHVQFYQPSPNAIALNRIRDTKASKINGRLTANGHVMLINPNGIVFGASSQVDVGALTATTADIDNNGFMAGKLNFNKAGKLDASIINHGAISVKDAGLVNLVAPHVENHGVIAAKLGKIQLAAADTFTLDMVGDGLLQVALTDEQAKKLVRNTGRISAEGGTIALTASRARRIVDSLVENTGIIEAHSMTKVGGKVILGGSHAKISGSINVNGKMGGGDVLIGGDYQGRTIDNVTTAKITEVSNTATIQANATDHGDGGKVIIWADDETQFRGHIEAKGGSLSGNGGFVEVSGKQTLTYAGFTDTRALHGGNGTLLLDPTDMTISTAADSANNINTTTLATNLNGSDIVITTASGGADAGNINVNNDVTWTSANNLTFLADNDITIDALITGTGGGDLTLDAQNDITVNSEIDIDGSFTAQNANNLFINNDITASTGITLADSLASSSLLSNADLVSYNGTLSIGTSGISAGANDLFLRAEDFDLRGNMTGSGELNFYGPNKAWSLGLGDSQIATTDADLSDAELDLIQDGFSDINFVFAWGGSSIHVGTRTWNDNVLFQTNNNPMYINGAQNVGTNNLSIFGARQTALNADLIGTGNLRILSVDYIGDDAVAGAGGGVGFDDTELGHIADGWNNIAFDQSNILIIDTDGYEFKDPTVFTTTNAGSLSVNDTMTVQAGSNASFNFRGYSNPLAIANNIDINAEIDTSAAAPGAGQVTFGNATNLNLGADITTGGGDITIADSVTTTTLDLATSNAEINLNADSGVISIGTGGVSATDNEGLRLNAEDFNINGDLTMRTLTFNANNNVDFGLGDSEAGATAHLSDAELDHIISTSYRTYFSANTLDVGAYSWNNNTQFSGTININGTQTVNGGRSLTMVLGSTNSSINADLTGTGDLIFRVTGFGNLFEIGDGRVSAELNNADLDRIVDGWNSIIFNSGNDGITFDTGGTYTFTDNVSFNARGGPGGGDIVIDSELQAAAGSDAGYRFSSGGLAASHTADINAAIDLSAGDGTGDIVFDDLDAVSIGADITTAGGDITIADDVTTTTLTTNAILDSGSGTISLGVGGLNAGANDVTFIADDLMVNGALTTTQNLRILPGTVSRSIGLGGGAGDLNINDAELALINAGDQLIIGSANAGDIDLDSWDLSSTNYDVEIYGDEIDLGGITMGDGSFLAYAQTTNSFEGLEVSDVISRTSAGTATLDLRANRNISLLTGADVISSTGSLNVILNSDRDALLGGAVLVDGASITTNDGYLVMGGGSGNIGGVDGILGNGDGTGADDIFAGHSGSPGRGGIDISNISNISTGTGDIFVRGKSGNNLRDGISIDSTAKSITTTSGNISIIGQSSFTGRAVKILNNNSIATIDGDIDIHGEITGSSAPEAVYISMEDGDAIQTDNGNISITGIANGLGNKYGINLDNHPDFLINGSGTLTLSGQGSGTSAGIVSINNPLVFGGINHTGNIILRASDLDLSSGGDIQTTGDITILPWGSVTSIGLGGGAGDLNINDAELAMINAGGKLIIGSNIVTTSDILSWDLMGTGYDIDLIADDIQVDGLTLGAGQFTMLADNDITIDALISGTGSGNLTLDAQNDITVNSEIDIDGSFTAQNANNIDINAEIDTSAAAPGAGQVTFGNATNLNLGADITTAGGDITIADSVTTTTLNSNLEWDVNGGEYNIGTGGIAGNPYILRLNDFTDIEIDGDVSIGGLYLFPNGGVTFGVGDGQVGAAHLSDLEVNRIKNVSNRVLLAAYAGGTNVGEIDWGANISTLQFDSFFGNMNINGTQTVSGNIRFAGNNPNITADLNGPGTLALHFLRSGQSIGDGHVNPSISDAELTFIQDGWSSIDIRTDNAATDTSINTLTPWVINAPVSLRSPDQVTINSSIVAAAGSDASLTVTNSTGGTAIINADIDLSDAAMGDGGIVFENNGNVLIGADLTTAGGDITIADNVVGTTLTTNAILNSDSGTISLGVGGLNAGANDVTFIADDLMVNGALTTTQNLRILPGTVSRSIGLGGGAGDLNINDAELALINAGGQLIIGSANAGDITIDSVDTSANIGGNTILATGSDFINASGVGGLNTGPNRFRIYTNDPSRVTRNGLSGQNIFNTAFPTLINSAIGNAFVFQTNGPPAPIGQILKLKNQTSKLPQTVEFQMQMPDTWSEVGKSYSLTLEGSQKSPLSGNHGASKLANNQSDSQKQQLQIKRNGKRISDLSSEDDASIRLVEANFTEIEEPIFEFYDLCSYNIKYCY